MSTDFTFLPDTADAPGHRMSEVNGHIPVLYLAGSWRSPSVRVQFNSRTPEATIAYLTTLVAEAQALLEAVKDHAGDAS